MAQEPLKRKPQRFVIFAFAAVIVAILALPIASGASQIFSGGGTATIFTEASLPIQGLGIGAGLSTYQALGIGTVPASNNTTAQAIITNDYLTYGVNNTTQTGYYSTSYLFSNLTMLQLNEHSANKFDALLTADTNGTFYFGYGDIGTNGSFNFVPLLSQNFTANPNGSIVSLALNPSLLTGSGTVAYEIQFQNATDIPSYTISTHFVGSAYAGPWYAIGLNSGYALAGSAVLILSILAIPHVSIAIKKGGKKDE